MKRTLTAIAAMVLAAGLGLALAADEGKTPTTAPAAVGKVVNVKCPIKGNAIDPEKVPAGLTRQFRGETVGFCCPGCPAQWDKLSDADKEAKLAAAKPQPPKIEK